MKLLSEIEQNRDIQKKLQEIQVDGFASCQTEGDVERHYAELHKKLKEIDENYVLTSYSDLCLLYLDKEREIADAYNARKKAVSAPVIELTDRAAMSEIEKQGSGLTAAPPLPKACDAPKQFPVRRITNTRLVGYAVAGFFVSVAGSPMGGLLFSGGMNNVMQNESAQYRNQVQPKIDSRRKWIQAAGLLVGAVGIVVACTTGGIGAPVAIALGLLAAHILTSSQGAAVVSVLAESEPPQPKSQLQAPVFKERRHCYISRLNSEGAAGSTPLLGST